MKSFPDTIFWSVTSCCNNACLYCYAAKNLRRVSTQKALDFIDLFHRHKVKRIVISGGEPLLHPDIDLIIKRIHSKKIEVCLDTSADHFSVHKKTIEKYVFYLGMPLDYPSEENSFRNKKNFQNVIGALEYFSTKKNRPKIRIGTVVTQKNINCLPQIYDLIKKYPIDLWKIYQFMPIGKFGKKNKKRLFLRDDEFFASAAFTKKKKLKFNILLSMSKNRTDAYFFLEANGQVYLPGEAVDNDSGLLIGDIEDSNITEKWLKAVNLKNYEKNIFSTFEE